MSPAFTSESLDCLSKLPQEEFVFAFWAAKILQTEQVKKRLLKVKRRFHNVDLDDLAIFFGLEFCEEVDDREKGIALKKYAANLLKEYSQSSLYFSAELDANLKTIAKVLELSLTDIAILRFFVMCESNRAFKECTDLLGELNRKQLIDVISWVLDLSTSKVTKAFAFDSVLYRTGLIKIDSNRSQELSRKVDVMDKAIDLVMTPKIDMQELMNAFCQPSELGHLSLDNFPHLEARSNDVLAYLRANRHKGINVLVYGPPGTGKTQWVKWITTQMNQSLYEIRSEDEDGDVVPAGNRVEMYQLAQRALKNQSQAIFLFDEVEDVFPNNVDGFFRRPHQMQNKSWLNTLLEENPVPAFWVSNQVSQIDPAYVRRFDFVIEIDVPPRSVRLQIIQDCLKGLNVSEHWKKGLSEHKQISPALISRVAKVFQKTPELIPLPTKTLETKVLQNINATLVAQGHKEIVLKQNAMGYSTDFIHTDIDVEGLVNGLKESGAGRLCLYGMPGTGKTAFGHYVAEQLDRPILIKRASDLLSPYVGEAEQNIAAAFAEAKRENAVLQIDEADSFLQNRENAQRSWEVTQVNELLTQMEAFEGVFIASTNLMDNIDAAAMRRFDLKLEFKALRAEQAWQLFLQSLPSNVSSEETLLFKEAFEQLSVLTPGDFAVVNRKAKLSGRKITPETLIKDLKTECEFKPNYNKQTGMGFLSSIH